MGKAIIVSAPSGAGKTTIVKHLLKSLPVLEFSVSACSRTRREEETDGKDYYFISGDEFRNRISRDEFVEWQEVYPGSYYGTLKSEMDRIWSLGKAPIFDVDVKGGLNLKKYFGANGLAIFIHPPSIEELENRLRKRGTESPESLEKRLDKAAYELSFADRFDRIVINDNLEVKCREVADLVQCFLNGKTDLNL
ncbi:MAG TPA: guanylate kinase [Bacteroidales bacterium]|nr:guanylate kinase [Bacteroidales bacterium]HPS63088.1 guanylate kinase [Bacteroidales bacterium]